MKIGLAGYVTVELRSAGGLLKRRLRFHNLITDVGMNLFVQRVTSTTPARAWNPGWIGLSTSTSAPAVSDTVLAGEIAGSRTAITESLGYVAASPDYTFDTRTASFGAGVGTGTIAKIGAFDAASGGNLLQEALLLDANGNPTTVVKGATDTLVVSWQQRVYPPQGLVTTPITVGGVPYNASYQAVSVSATGLWRQAAQNGIQFSTQNPPGIKSYQSSAFVARSALAPANNVQPIGNFVAMAWDAQVPGQFQLTGRFSANGRDRVFYIGNYGGIPQSAFTSSEVNELFGLMLDAVPPAGTTVDVIVSWARGTP